MGLMYNLQSCVNREAIPGDIITLRLANESSAFIFLLSNISWFIFSVNVSCLFYFGLNSCTCYLLVLQEVKLKQITHLQSFVVVDVHKLTTETTLSLEGVVIVIENMR